MAPAVTTDARPARAFFRTVGFRRAAEWPPRLNRTFTFVDEVLAMEYARIEIRLSMSMVQSVEQLARDEDRTVGQIVRDLLAKEIARAGRARPPIRADERLVAPLRARLASDFALAGDWEALQRRLREKGFVLRAAGGGLALHDWPGDRRLCKASELGFSYGRLMQRFRTPFPGHPHIGLEGRFGLGQGAGLDASGEAFPPYPDEDDPVLIEPCD